MALITEAQPIWMALCLAERPRDVSVRVSCQNCFSSNCCWGKGVGLPLTVFLSAVFYFKLKLQTGRGKENFVITVKLKLQSHSPRALKG
jgi:hypothetical protein